MGTQTLVLPDGRGPRLLNGGELQRRARSMLTDLSSSGMQIDGGIGVLLQIDAEGHVQRGNANTGNPELDEALDLFWWEARFDPAALGGCRIPVWYHVPISFSSTGSGLIMQIAPPPAG